MLIEFKNKIYQGSNNRPSLFDCAIPENAKAVVIFAHGYKGYKDWGAWHLVETFFLKSQYGFVKFNMSHNGGTIENAIDFPDLEAFGKNTYSFEINDLNTVIDETVRIIETECNLDIPLYLLGHSRGGGVSILTSIHNDNVKKIISLAGISDIASRFKTGKELDEWKEQGVYFVQNSRTLQEMPHYYSFYEDFLNFKKDLNIERVSELLEVPFLQIHGDMDLAVSISEGQMVARWTNTALEIIKGAGHTFGAQHPWNSDKLPEDLEKAIEKALAFFDN